MDKKTYDEGLAVRRAVLGAEYVDKSVRAPDEFSKPMQDLVTEYCWGAVWTRPELDRRTRSFLNLAMLTALIREVFLQSAIYCGVPAALDAMRVAKEVFAEVDSKK